MMECKVERDNVEFVSQNICVSVFANGRFYSQEVTEGEMRKAFKKALISIDVIPKTLVQTRKESRLFVRKKGKFKSKFMKHISHASRI